jgi:phage-related protein
MDDKPIIWIHTEIKTPPFSASAREHTGFLLRKLQYGERLEMPDSRPLPGIGSNCYELRIHDRDKNAVWRIVYHISSECIVILHTFMKKTEKTPQTVIDLSKKRLSMFYKDIED